MKIEGLKDLEKQLQALSARANRTVMNNTLKAAAEPIADSARSNAPKDKGNLADSIITSKKLNKAQSKAQRAYARANGGKDQAELYVGSSDSKAHLLEFGTAPHINGGKFAGSKNPGLSPQPFMRPAWEANKDNTIKIITEELQNQILKAAARAAKRAAKGK